MADRHIEGCIYCGSLGPFSDEHVVSAGLGGDDSAWLLKNCVCRVCNTDIFSKLESKFLRASPVALARLFLQDRTRDRGSRTSPPTIQPNLTVCKDANTGILLAAQMLEKGRTIVFPQIIVLPRTGEVETAVTGSNVRAVNAFLDQFASKMADELILIEKRRDGFEVVFDLTSLRWADDAYNVEATCVASKPAVDGIWIELIAKPSTADAKLPLAVFGLPTGQIVCRAGSVAVAAVLLSFLRQNPQVRRLQSSDPKMELDDNPSVHLRLGIDLAGYSRVFTKIGVNLCAHLLGLEQVRDPAFDRAIIYARDGSGSASNPPANSMRIFGPPLPSHHVMMLCSTPGTNGGHAVIFMAQLYSGPIERLMLAELPNPIASLSAPIVIHVDYQNNHIERLTLEEHVNRVASLHGDFTRNWP